MSEQAIVPESGGTSRYKPVVYTGWVFDHMKTCAVNWCDKPKDDHYFMWVHIGGREKKIPFCSVHGPQEDRDEQMYRLGM